MGAILSGVAKGLLVWLLVQSWSTVNAFETATAKDTGASGFKVAAQNAAAPLLALETGPTKPTAAKGASGWACFGTSHGASCLDADGQWLKFTAEGSPLASNEISATAVCPGGLALFAHEAGVDTFDGSSWRNYAKDSWDRYGTPTTLACDGHGGFWVGHERGAAHFDGSCWQGFDRNEITQGRGRRAPQQIRIAPGDVTWFNVRKGISRFANGSWVSYYPGRGLPKVNYSFKAIAIDTDGHPQALEAKGGFLVFDGQVWSFQDADVSNSSHALAVDRKNRKWVASERDGLQLIEGSSITLFKKDNSPLTSDRVHSLAVDAAGRVWVGTAWGLNVIHGDQWRAYHMHSSELPDNAVLHVAVSGAGPNLPRLAEKTPGSLTGRLLRHGKPVAGAEVEICAQSVGMLFRGPSPCASKPHRFQGLTDKDGVFRLNDLPIGRYVVYLKSDASWMRLGKGIAGMRAAWLRVQEGKATDLGALDIANSGRAQNDGGPRITQPDLPDVKLPKPSLPEPTIPRPSVPTPALPKIDLPGVAVSARDNDLVITIDSQILFDFDRAVLRPDAEATLVGLAPLLAGEFAARKIRVAGHTDSKGTPEYNQELSERRAAAVKDWLATAGKVSARRLESVGYGESQPVAPNHQANGQDNPEGRQKNRRVELVLSEHGPGSSPANRVSRRPQ